MAIKATHTGTCQCCGRDQMLPGGRLSKHGYTVEWGYFQGVCYGADELPLEQDRTVCDKTIADLTAQAVAYDKRADDIKAGRRVPEHAFSGFECRDREGKWTRVMVPYADATEYNQENARNAAIFESQSTAKQMRSHATMLAALADRITGKQAIKPRADENRKELKAGSRFTLWGQTYTVLRTEFRKAWGVGPHLNGQTLLHVVFERNGKEDDRPVRLIRQNQILD